MVMPTQGHIQPVTLVNPDGTPGTITIADVQPGTVVTTPADVAVGVGATVALPALPTGIRRMTIQVTGGDSLTLVRVREVGAGAGRGNILSLYSSRMYGEGGGAVAALEVQHVAGAAASVCIQYERD